MIKKYENQAIMIRKNKHFRTHDIVKKKKRKENRSID